MTKKEAQKRFVLSLILGIVASVLASIFLPKTSESYSSFSFVIVILCFFIAPSLMILNRRCCKDFRFGNTLLFFLKVHSFVMLTSFPFCFFYKETMNNSLTVLIMLIYHIVLTFLLLYLLKEEDGKKKMLSFIVIPSSIFAFAVTIFLFIDNAGKCYACLIPGIIGKVIAFSVLVNLVFCILIFMELAMISFKKEKQ